MLIRIAQECDAEAIGQLRVSAWRAAYKDLLPAAYLDELDPNSKLEQLKISLRFSSPLLKVAEHNTEVTGFSVLGAPRYTAKEHTLELWAIYVHPARWRQRIGRALMREALQDAGARGAKRVELWCLEGNERARSFYESLGFVRNGEDRVTTALTGLPLHEIAYEHSLNGA